MDHEAMQIIYGIIAVVLGSIVCLAGYRLFSVLLYFIGFLIGYVVVYILLEDNTDFPIWSMVLIAAIAGLICGILSRMLWRVAVFLLGAFGGYLVGSFIQSINNGLIHPTWGVWLLLCTCMIIGGLLALFIVKESVIIVTAVTGAYFVMYGIDALADLNALFTIKPVQWHKHGTDADSDLEYFEWKWETYLLLGGWVVLAIVGIVVQMKGPLKDYNHEKDVNLDENCVLPCGCCGKRKYDTIN